MAHWQLFVILNATWRYLFYFDNNHTSLTLFWNQYQEVVESLEDGTRNSKSNNNTKILAKAQVRLDLKYFYHYLIDNNV